MGNAEVRRICQPTPILEEEIGRLQRLHATFRCEFTLDRQAFCNLLDPMRVPFDFIDSCFQAFDTNNDGVLDVGEIVLLVCFGMTPSSDVECVMDHLKARLRLLFQIFDTNGDRLVSKKELVEWVQKTVSANIERTAKFENTYMTPCADCGLALAPEYHYRCLGCPTTYVLGLPELVLRCTTCGVRHQHKTHHPSRPRGTKADEERKISLRGQSVHRGMMCAACEVTPVVGPLYLCRDCPDDTCLCQACFENHLEPNVHDAGRHDLDRRDCAVPIHTLVESFVSNLFAEGDLNGDGYLTWEEFVSWGVASPTVLRVMTGCPVTSVRMCEHEEYATYEERAFLYAKSIGVIPAEEATV
eukprot:PhM_4_TR8190/c0_g1_i1/m.82004